MKKILGLLLISAFLLTTSNAFATFIDSYWDLNAVAIADSSVVDTYFTADGGDGVTEALSQFTYYALTESVIQSDGSILDAGMAYATSVNPTGGNIPPDDEGYYSAYGLTFVWDDLAGQVTNVASDGTISAIYTSGTINFYIDYDPFGVSQGNVSTYTDGFQVATLAITSGAYELNPGSGNGWYELNGTYTSILDNFWFDAVTGDDLSDDLLSNNWVVAYTHGDNDPSSVDIAYNPDGSMTVTTDHDASMELGVVPEPGTVLLLGLGLCGLGFAGYRRKRS